MQPGKPIGGALLLVVMMGAGLVCQTGAQTLNTAETRTGQTDRAATHQAVSQEVGPPDVYLDTLLVRDELEWIRLEMGKPQDTRREIEVTGAAPREVFFQALTLFQKANRLSFDLTRERAELPGKPIGDIRAVHVGSVVNATLERLRRVKDYLRGPQPGRERPRDPTKTTSDIFRSIVQANRQLNLLLDQSFTPTDVFQQVTLAVGYAAQLRTRFPGTRMLDPPAFEPHKRPVDVYHRLVECFARVRDIIENSGLDALMLGGHPEVATPSDVYDIASLIVSELSFLHSHLDGALTPPDRYDPGRKFPSDVYQRAGLLEALLLDLQARVEVSSTWLQAEDARE